MAKTALVVSGGGSKGAFAVGALQYMIEERHLEFDIVSGTSTGAVIATLLIAGELALLNEIYSKITTREVLKRNRLWAIACRKVQSWYSTKPLEDLIDRRFTPEMADKVLGSVKQMFLTTVCLQTGAIVYFQTGRKSGHSDEPSSKVVRIEDRAHLVRAILASTNQPVLMPPVEVEPGDVAQYVDGGVREYAPIQIVVDNGATDIYAVVLSPEPTARTPIKGKFRKIERILLRTIDLLSEEVGENDLRIRQRDNQFLGFLDMLKERMLQLCDVTPAEVNGLFEDDRNPVRGMRPVTLHLIRPRTELPTDGLEFDPVIMREMMKMGREEAERVLSGQP